MFIVIYPFIVPMRNTPSSAITASKSPFTSKIRDLLMPILATVAFTASAPAQVCWPAEAGVAEEASIEEDPRISKALDKLSKDKVFLGMINEYDRVCVGLRDVPSESIRDARGVTEYFWVLDKMLGYIDKRKGALGITRDNALEIVVDPYSVELCRLLFHRPNQV